ncbi:hypothetical protein LCI18_013770 [Fusarium solani-melongenae]|uniref:Uncharacterized protein n=1 Tax=Fusarium solani subsp. cucurbitae TaxID=2747967 RepID=A0ACD3ZP10_FUSSC|nr:hypothetical protein LCI18_013770 [Fusarium solani-melongenae]
MTIRSGLLLSQAHFRTCKTAVITMFGRRRRPILGAAVVVGASRAAARHEVERQAVMNTQRELEIQREVELRRRNEEEQERRMQRAVDEAIQKAAVENPAPQHSVAALATPPPPQQYYSTQSPIPVQPQDVGLLATMPGQPYTPGPNVPPSIQPGQLMPSPPQPPAYSPRSLSQDGGPSAQGISPTVPATGSTTKYCTQCGFACQVVDRFCRQCGAKQVGSEGKVE